MVFPSSKALTLRQKGVPGETLDSARLKYLSMGCREQGNKVEIVFKCLFFGKGGGRESERQRQRVRERERSCTGTGAEKEGDAESEVGSRL